MSTTAQCYLPTACPHHRDGQRPSGLALVTIGNALRSDDGIGQAVHGALPKSLLKEICYFDLGPYTYFLVDCLRGHSSAIIIDSTIEDHPPGTLTILDLQEVVAANSPLKCEFSHGFSLIDELRVGSWRGLLPGKILFVGVEAASTDWSDQLSDALAEKLPEVASEVERLIHGVLEREPANA